MNEECVSGLSVVLGSVVETSKELRCVSSGIWSLEGMAWSLSLSLLLL